MTTDPATARKPEIISRQVSDLVDLVCAATDQPILIVNDQGFPVGSNEAFSLLFDLDSSEVLRATPVELAVLVRSRMDRRQSRAWKPVPADLPCQITFSLGSNPPREVSCQAKPVALADRHNLIVWTFEDRANQQRLLRMLEIVAEISSYQQPDPAVVYRRVMSMISAYFGKTTCILSVKRGDYMDFRAVVGPLSPIKLMRGNPLKDAYCQFALKEMSPLLVQNAKEDSVMKSVQAAKVGYTRYLGVPVTDSEGAAVGTLCILDDKSSEILDREDKRFMLMMAARVSSELAREDAIKSRMAEHQHLFERQAIELQSTNQVLSAMNSSFAMLQQGGSFDSMLERQTLALRGLLGYSGVAFLKAEPSGPKLSGFVLACGTRQPKKVSIANIGEFMKPGASTLENPLDYSAATDDLVSALKCSCVGLVKLEDQGKVVGLLALASEMPMDVDDPLHRAHLNAIVDQVKLVLIAFGLHHNLKETHEELKLTQGQLVQSEKLSAVGTLAASTAHDIRNILATLQLELDSGQTSHQEIVASVREQLSRFSVLSHRLLSYAKPVAPQRESVDLQEVLDRAILLTSPQIKVNGVELECRFECRECILQADRQRVEHLFINLILNAVQAMTGTQRALQIHTKRLGSRVVITVSDTGKGIPPEIMKQLFQPFQSSRSNGFGLGLYSCKHIVDEHGGRIRAKRRFPNGTRFVVEFPTALEGDM